MTAAIVDTGPLVAFFDRSERHHRWVIERIDELRAPLLVCEPVLAETMHLLGHARTAQNTVLQLLQNGALKIAFQISEHVDVLRELMRKYHDTPISLADACLVRMSEIHPQHAILTLDSDFSIYRKQGRVPLMLMRPSVNHGRPPRKA